MKISKYFMVAAASIMMFGCAKNDDVRSLADEGPVALTIKIADPQLGSKTAVDPTTAREITWNEVTVTLNADNGPHKATITKQQATKGYTFWDVEGPQSVEVSINGGKATYTDLTDFGSNVAATAVPVYGMSSDFHYAGTATNNDTQYNLYEIEVTAQIPVARLELSGIKHADHEEGKDCWYSAITFDKIELLNAPDVATFTNGVFVATPGESDVLSEDIPAEGNDFKTNTFPESGKCYAFNMFAGMPTLRFTFTRSTADGAITEQDAYAVVKTFKNGDEEITFFEAGKIYQITDIQIADESITPDPSGNTLVAVEVTVDVADWTIVNTTVEF